MRLLSAEVGKSTIEFDCTWSVVYEIESMKRKRIEELDENLKSAEVAAPAELQWIDAASPRFAKRGLAWFEENRATADATWSRLPARAEKLVREAVWQLAQSPASGHLAFRTDSTRIAVRAKSASLDSMPHMPISGSRGVQLYSGSAHRMKPVATAIPAHDDLQFERMMIEKLTPQLREFRLYLPLYCGLEKLELGLEKASEILAPSPAAVVKPVVFYGTSITQGGCASAPGHDFVSQIGRLLNIETVNLGFSGNGKGEVEVARLLGEIDASLFVLDYAANVDEALLRKTLPRFVDALRAARPDVPILIMSNVCFSQYFVSAAARSSLESRRDAMMNFYVSRRKRGDRNIHFVDGFGLLPFGTDAAYVDGVHPTDHGFSLMAQRLAPVVEQILLMESD